MDGFTIFWLILVVFIAVTNYLFCGTDDKSNNPSSTDEYKPMKFISPPTEIYNWQTDLSKSDQIGNMYHNNNRH